MHNLLNNTTESILNALQKSGEALHGELKLVKVLQTILDQLSQVLTYDSASIMLLHADRLEIVADKGFRSESQRFSYDQLSKLQHIQQVLHQKSPLIIPNTDEDERWYHLPDSDYIHCWLGVPLIVKGEVIGILNIDKEQANYYIDHDKKIAQAFSLLAAVAIEHARLYSNLSETNERLYSLVSSAFDAAFVIDAEKRIRIFNEQAEKKSGFTGKEIEGWPVEKIFVDEQNAREVFERVNQDGSISDAELKLRHVEGKAIPVLLSAKKIVDKEGKSIGQVGFLKDLRQAYLLQDWLYSLNKSISSPYELEKILKKVIEAALVAFPSANRGTIHLWDEQSGELKLSATDFDFSLDARKAQTFPKGQGIAGWVFENNQPLMILDASLDDRYIPPQHPEVHVHRAMISVPIRLRSNIIGVLTLSHLTLPNLFSEDDKEPLSGFAERAAIAIDNARQYQEILKINENTALLQEIGSNISKHIDIEQVLESIVEGGRKLLGVEMAVLHLVDETAGRILQSIAAPPQMEYLMTPPRLKDGLTGCIINKGEPVIIPDTNDPRVNPEVRARGIRSLIGFPVKTRGKVIGTLFLNSTSPRYFGRQEVESVGLLVTQAAVAIENARTVQSLERSTRLTTALMRASQKLTESHDLNQQLNMIWKMAADEFSAPMFYIGIYDELTDTITFPIIYDMYQPFESQPVSLSHRDNWGIAGYVVKTNEFICWHTLEEKNKEIERLKIKPRRSGIECQTCLALPLKIENRVIGVISIQSDRDFAWNEEEIEAFKALANLAAVAINNTQLINQNQEGKNRLQAAYNASKEIASTLDAKMALQAVVEYACQTLGACRSVAMLIDEINRPTLLACVGYGPTNEGAIDIRPDGISVQVVRSGQPCFIPDVQSQSIELNQGMIEGGVKSAACLPMEYKSQRIGVLWVCYPQPHIFTDAEQEALKLYASQAAIAYENAIRMTALEDMFRSAEALTKATEAKDVIKQMVRHARYVFKSDSTAFFPYDYDIEGGKFILDDSDQDGMPVEVWQKFRRKEPRKGKTAYTILEHGWIGVRNVNEIDRYPYLGASTIRLIEEVGITSFQGISLAVGIEKSGVLYINYNHPRSFDQDDKELAQAYANLAALALKKARLMAQLKTAHDTADTITRLTVSGKLEDVLDAIVKGTRRVIGCDVVTLYPYDQATDEFGRPAIAGVRFKEKVWDSSHVAKGAVPYRIIKLKEMHIAEDAKSDPYMKGKFIERVKIKSSVGIPLKIGNQTIGVMFVNFKKHHRLNSDEIANIRLYSQQAAVAIWNAKLISQTKKQSEDAQALYKASQAVVKSLDLEQILNQIAEQARMLTGYQGVRANYANILLVEGNKAQFVSAYPPEELGKIIARLGKEFDWMIGIGGRVGITGRAIQTHKTQRIANVNDPDLAPDYLASHPETRSEMAVPILFQNEVIGVINVESDQVGAFDHFDERSLDSLATQAAEAIHNAHQYEKLQRLINYQTAIYKASKAISAASILEETPLLDIILQQAVEQIIPVKGQRIVLGAIQRHDEANNRLILASVYPLSALQKHNIGEVRSLDRSKGLIGVSGRTVKLKTAQLVDNVGEDADYVKFNEETGSELDIPLMEGDKVLGVLSLESDTPAAFDAENQAALESLAELAIIAIQNTRRYQDLMKIKGLVGNKNAIDWMRMVSTSWGHAVRRDVGVIKNLIDLIKTDIEHKDWSMLEKDLKKSQETADRIKDVPIIAPLNTEDVVGTVHVNKLIKDHLSRVWKRDPYQSIILDLESLQPDLDELTTTRASPEWLRRLFEILTENAVQAMLDHKSPVKKILIATKLIDENIEIIIKDTGPGIPEEVKAKRMVEPVNKPAGSRGAGLGLVQAKLIVETYGGKINFLSSDKDGTKFQILLPSYR